MVDKKELIVKSFFEVDDKLQNHFTISQDQHSHNRSHSESIVRICFTT